MGVGDSAVQMNFCGGEVSRSCADITRILNEVSSYSESGAIWFGFVGPIGAYKSGIGGIVVGGNFGFGYKEDGISALDACANALSQAAKFICTAELPGGLDCWVGMLEKLAIFQVFPSIRADDAVGLEEKIGNLEVGFEKDWV